MSKRNSVVSPRRFTRRAMLGTVGLAAGAAVVSACAGQSSTSTPTPTGRASAAPSGPQKGGTMVIGNDVEPASLLPLSGKALSAVTYIPLFSRLVWLDKNFAPAPELANSWQIAPDGLSYTFQLNANAKWHDGKPVTASDAEFTFNELFAKLSPTRSLWWPKVASAKADGERVFTLKLKEPFAPLMTYLAHPLGYAEIYPKHVYGGTDMTKVPATDVPVGSGPFKLKEWVKGGHIEFVRNDAYFRSGKPYLDRLIIQNLPDANSRTLAFEKGEVDFLSPYNTPLDNIEGYRKDARYAIIEGGLGVAADGFLLMNVAKSPILQKKAVRQAIAHAIDREAILKQALAGQGKVAHSPLSSQIAPYYKGSYDVYAYDVAKAAKLLDDAGYPKGADGKRFKLRLTNRVGRQFEARAVDIMRSQLAQVGIDATVGALDSSAYTPKVMSQRDFDLVLQLYTTGPDPLQGVDFLFDTVQIGVNNANAMGYSNPALDAIFKNTTKESGQRRVDLYDQAQKIIMDDLPALPLYEYPNVAATSAKLHDAVVGAMDYVGNRENAYVTVK